MDDNLQTELQKQIHTRSETITDPAERRVRILTDGEAAAIEAELGCTIREIYRAALKNDIYPYRYLRNREGISTREQLTLAESKVAVVGAGGLGGQVIMLLARMGVGHLVVIDHDVFDETNLNRQALSDKDSLGKSKALQAADMVASVNPGVRVTACETTIDSSNSLKILEGSNVIVDALDNVADRFVLEEAAKKVGIPLVHGALAGFEGQMMTIFPEDPGLELVYGTDQFSADPAKRPEYVLGVPTPTPAFVATLEAMEVFKILLHRGRLFRNGLVHVDLESGRVKEFRFQNGSSE